VKRSFVADASVAIAWVHPAQATEATDLLLDGVAAGDSLVVPALWPLEVTNALVVLQRRRKLTTDECRIAIELIREIPVSIDHEAASVAFTRLHELASEHGLTIYDAAYLELARRRKLPLASNDGHLREAASKAGVALWRPA
jgi:predicted nucleic acid-binding protein